MITAIIVDDEKKNVTMLATMVQKYCPHITILGTAHNAATGKILVETLHPALIFLDIEMPYGNGFDLLRSLPDAKPEIIFITAFNKYALNAFRFSAVDYLLKPVNIEELVNAVNRAEQKINEKKIVQNYDLLLRNLTEKDIEHQTIAFSDTGQLHLVKVSDIMYIIADGSYTHIHTTAKVIVSTKNLNDFETMFPAAMFCRVHRGHIINKNYIAKIQKGRGGTVLMKDGTELEIAVRRKDDFLKMFQG